MSMTRHVAVRTSCSVWPTDCTSKASTSISRPTARNTTTPSTRSRRLKAASAISRRSNTATHSPRFRSATSLLTRWWRIRLTVRRGRGMPRRSRTTRRGSSRAGFRRSATDSSFSCNTSSGSSTPRGWRWWLRTVRRSSAAMPDRASATSASTSSTMTGSRHSSRCPSRSSSTRVSRRTCGFSTRTSPPPVATSSRSLTVPRDGFRSRSLRATSAAK